MKAIYKPVQVEYVIFTNSSENIEELTTLLGDIPEIDNTNVDDPELIIDEFTSAHLGDYVVKEDDYYEIYGEVEFNDTFDKID